MPRRKKHDAPEPLEAFRFPVTGLPVVQHLPPAVHRLLPANSFPAGPCCNYEYDYTSLAFTEIGEEVLQLTGVPRHELLHKNAMQFFSQLIAPEHVFAAIKLTALGYELQTRFAGEQALTCIEYNIVTRSMERKRFLFQFCASLFTNEGLPLRAQGTITDITHMKPEGTPSIYVLLNNRVVFYETARAEDLLPATELPLTMNEVTVLTLKAKGLRTKEIAVQTGLKELSVYSLVRNIRQKSGMDIPQLITLLREKGVING
ncbi:MAG: helix-turn-helix transcriptional regulator [Lacibacter sp.]|jgi:DNA-binding CsgD family transcriptional regulator